MENETLVESGFSAIINATIEAVDIPWPRYEALTDHNWSAYEQGDL